MSSQKIIVITLESSGTNIYTRIWNTTRDGRRVFDANICYKCRHQIMLTQNHYPKTISRTGSRHQRVYYHGEECYACGKVCGEFLIEGESRPI